MGTLFVKGLISNLHTFEKLSFLPGPFSFGFCCFEIAFSGVFVKALLYFESSLVIKFLSFDFWRICSRKFELWDVCQSRERRSDLSTSVTWCSLLQAITWLVLFHCWWYATWKFGPDAPFSSVHSNSWKFSLHIVYIFKASWNFLIKFWNSESFGRNIFTTLRL